MIQPCLDELENEMLILAIKINSSLGATPLMELMIASGKAVPKLQLEHGLAVDRVYTGSFMTSLDMAGLEERNSIDSI